MSRKPFFQAPSGQVRLQTPVVDVGINTPRNIRNIVIKLLRSLPNILTAPAAKLRRIQRKRLRVRHVAQARPPGRSRALRVLLPPRIKPRKPFRQRNTVALSDHVEPSLPIPLTDKALVRPVGNVHPRLHPLVSNPIRKRPRLRQNRLRRGRRMTHQRNAANDHFPLLQIPRPRRVLLRTQAPASHQRHQIQ